MLPSDILEPWIDHFLFYCPKFTKLIEFIINQRIRLSLKFIAPKVLAWDTFWILWLTVIPFNFITYPEFNVKISAKKSLLKLCMDSDLIPRLFLILQFRPFRYKMTPYVMIIWTNFFIFWNLILDSVRWAKQSECDFIHCTFMHCLYVQLSIVRVRFRTFLYILLVPI